VEAHPLSVSRSELRIEDGLARLTIRLPKQELEHVAAANRDLPLLFRIAGVGPASKRCEFDGDDLVCRAAYLGPKPLKVECDLPAAVLPHHIHTLSYAGRAFIFTPAVTKHDLDESAPSFPWVAAGLAVVALAAAVRSLRSRQNRPASS
jgi:hypothetical protein